MFVIKRDDGKFVAKHGSAHSYTDKLQHAQTYASKAEADRHACSNERVLALNEAMT